jgi:hypothetical protein
VRWPGGGEVAVGWWGGCGDVKFGRHLAAPANVGDFKGPGLRMPALMAFSLPTEGELVHHAWRQWRCSGARGEVCGTRGLLGAVAVRASAARCSDHLLGVCGRASWLVATGRLHFRKPCEHSTPTLITCMRRKVCSLGVPLTRHGPLVGW